MSNDKQQPAPPKPPQSIPCRALNFSVKRTLPNKQMSDVVQAETQQNIARFTIEYLPGLQFYRVAYFAPSATEPSKVLMYPREWASFEPCPL